MERGNSGHGHGHGHGVFGSGNEKHPLYSSVNGVGLREFSTCLGSSHGGGRDREGRETPWWIEDGGGATVELNSVEARLLAEENSKPQLDVESEKSAAKQKVWVSFQNTATSIAQVYVEKGVTGAEAFRNAARYSTALYKETIENADRLVDVGMAAGYSRRTKEILDWAAKRRRVIRREDLIAKLSGIADSLNAQQREDDEESDLDTFRAAVSRFPTLQTFVTSEFQRSGKRSASPASQADVHMASPQPKRTRFF